MTGAHAGGRGRTLVVTNDFPPRAGGIETFVLHVARRLPPGRVVVHTASQRGDRAFDATLPFPVVRDPSPLLVPTPAITRRVVATARAQGCDSVWFGAAAPLALMAPALRRAGVRHLVATTHGHEVWWSTLPGSRALLRRIGEGVDVVTYLNGWCRARVERPLTPAARARMRRLVPGIDVDLFAPGRGGGQVRRRHGLGTRPVVVCVSRLVARKGQDVLVRAMPAIRREVPDAALLLVGDGPRRAALERLVDRLGLRGSVVLTGAVPWQDAPAHYDAGDVFCMPARTRLAGLEPEALGTCYLEAAACGLPVVAGDSGGGPDSVLVGEGGRVVDGRDTGAVAAAVAGYLRDPDLARRSGLRGREWVSGRWRPEVTVARLERMLAGLDPDEPGE